MGSKVGVQQPIPQHPNHKCQMMDAECRLRGGAGGGGHALICEGLRSEKDGGRTRAKLHHGNPGVQGSEAVSPSQGGRESARGQRE